MKKLALLATTAVAAFVFGVSGASATIVPSSLSAGISGDVTPGQTATVNWTATGQYTGAGGQCQPTTGGNWSADDGEQGITSGGLTDESVGTDGQTWTCVWNGSFQLTTQTTADQITVSLAGFYGNTSFSDTVDQPAPPTVTTPDVTTTTTTTTTTSTDPSDPLQQEIDELKAELAALQAQFADLSTRVQRLEGANDAAEAQYSTDVKLGLSPQQAALDAESQALNFLYKLGAFASTPAQ